MPNLLGSIAVSLGLDASEYVGGLSKAEYQAQKTARAIVSNLESIKRGAESVGVALGVGFGVHEVKEWATSVLDGAEKLHNLSIETGSSIEKLSKLENQVVIAGGSFDDLKTRLDRFAGGLGGTDEQGQKVAQVMKLLGVTAREPAEALQETAQKLNQFADGTNKAALARAAFGRDGVAFLSSLKAIAEEQDVSATKTKEQIDNAVKLAGSWRTLVVESHGLRDAFLVDIVPALTSTIERFKLAREAGLGFFSSLDLAARNKTSGKDSLQFVISQMSEQADEVAKLQARLAAQRDNPLANLFRGGPPGTDSADQRALETARQRLSALQTIRNDIILKQPLGDLGDQVSRSIRPEALSEAPPLPDTQALKAALAAQLADIKAASEQEKAILAVKNEVSSGAYEQSLISLKQFGDQRRQALSDQLANDTRSFEDGRKAIEKFLATPALLPVDKFAAQKDLIELTRRYTLTTIEAQKESEKLFNDDAKAAREFRNSIEELNAQVAELNGNTAEAARIRDKFQTDLQRKQFVVSGETGAAASIDFINKQKEAQAVLNDARTRYGLINDEVSIKQARVDLLAQSGVASELELYAKRAEVARQYVGVLSAQADAQQRAAEALAAGPAREQALLDVQRMRLGIDQLKLSADGLKISLDNSITGDFTTFLDAIEEKPKSIAQSFKAMGASIAKTIAHLANEDIAKGLYRALTGAMGGQSPGGFIASLIGAGASAFSGAGAASTGLGYGTAGSLIPAGPYPYAEGTDFHPGGWAKLGEAGPELVRLPRGAQVFTNRESQLMARGGGGTTINQYITNTPGVSRQSSGQASGELLRRAQQGMRGR